MCGIWGLLDKNMIINNKIYDAFNSIKHRGPDNSNFSTREFQNYQIITGFHRLAIHDLTVHGNQPFYLQIGNRLIITLVNGEIYNYTDLVAKYNLKDIIKSTSDCEVIPYIYMKYGIEELVNNLDGEFAFSIIDIGDKLTVHLGRDPFGVRPLFYSDANHLCFSSEAKGLLDITDHASIKQFPPGTFSTFNLSDGTTVNKEYYSKDYKIERKDISMLPQIRKSLKDSVKMMIDSDRPIGALLSGGLDSSLVVSIVSKYLRNKGKKLRTFSIGIPGSTDKEFAIKVSEFCDTDHTHIEFTNKEFLDIVPTVIKAIETYDITTIRASVGQYLIGKWIRNNTDIKVLFIGDGSDEVTCGYMYFHKAPSSELAHYDNCKLLKEIHNYDVLRADRGIASHGLEARVPFLSKKFVDTFMSFDPNLRIPILEGGRMVEKWLLRKAFDNGKYLPNEILWRKKEAFSDGVSSKEKSWYQIIQDNVTCEYLAQNYEYLKPVSPESAYYRQIFDKNFPGLYKLVPHYWLPSWCDTLEPSARTLDVYK